MKQHKWQKEIKAWADGAEIEKWMLNDTWQRVGHPDWYEFENYRIKSQCKHGIEVGKCKLGETDCNKPQPFLGMKEIPYKDWVLRFYKMPNNLWYTEGINDEWMNEMVEASKPQPKEPQYLYVYGDRYATLTSLEKSEHHSGLPLKAKIKLGSDDA